MLGGVEMDETNLLMIGTVTSASQSKTFVSANINPGPAEIVQKYLISGLCNSGLKSVEVVTAPRIPSYPKTTIKKVDDDEWSIGQATIHSIGFNNLEGIGFIDRAWQIKKASLRWADRLDKGKKIVLVYSMHSPFLDAARSIKKKYTDTTVAIIVPDLPQYMSIQKGIKKFLKERDMARISSLMTCVDKYVLYTKYMADYFRLNKDKWVVLEGLMDVSKIVPNTITKVRKRPICMYAGRLDVRYAIDKLIEAFGYVSEAELHLYGSPSDAKKLQSLIDKYENVSYMGTLSQDDVFQRMREVDLLLNPRPTNIELAKYSCPSKTFEYMASGTPVLMTRLPGLPDEYYPYLYFFDTENVEGFARKINEVLHKGCDELQEKGRQAQQFLVENKDAGKQVRRIMRFITGD